MRKIIFRLYTGYCGMEGTENGTYPDDITEAELNEEAYLRALQHAESYGLYPIGDGVLDDEEDGDEYVDSIEGIWEDYDSEKHDGLVCGGGEWNWDE